MKAIFRIGVLLVAMSAMLSSCSNAEQQNAEQQNAEPCGVEIDTTVEVVAEAQTIYGINVDSLAYEDCILKRGENLGTILRKYGVSGQTLAEAEKKISGVFDLRRMRAGNKYCAIVSADTLQSLRHLVYEIDQVDYFVVSFGEDSVGVSRGSRNVRVVEKVSEGVIETSLWNAVVGQGLQWDLAMKLSDIYAWNIDFFGLQKGDMFRVLYTERWVDSTFIGIDTIKCAMFSHTGRDFLAVPFVVGGRMDYFDHSGQSLRKAFLKAPLKYSRISSTFSHSRFHPVLQVRRPHHGIDYAAPTGTPVMSIGDGRVVGKGYDSKGGGNYVKVQHNSTYTTVYMHLSRFAKGVKAGMSVKQSDVIGYVGATGLATGPHLDFRVYKNGKPTDPLRVESPAAEPLPTDSLDRFIVVRDSLLNVMSED